MLKRFTLASLVALAAVTVTALPASTPALAQSGARTVVRSQPDLQRLLRARSMSLQWISWDRRGTVRVVRNRDGRVRITGSQRQGNASVTIGGDVTEIGRNYFTFDGSIYIRNTPDAGRDCQRQGPMTFRVTQNRRYWRLQNMEACGDGLTDYVDIYF